MRIFAWIAGVTVLAGGALFALSLYLIQVPDIVADDNDLAGSIESWLDERHSQTPSQFNGAALVIRDGEVLVRKAWGNDGNGRPLSVDSQFRLASVSKSFTAAAILKLAQEHTLDLDAPVSDQIDTCPVTATPAQLLQHRSGVPDNYFQVADPETLTTISSVLDLVCSNAADHAGSPQPFSYNNTAYVFLAGLVEHKSGMSFEQYLGQEILAPLGLEDTRVWNLVSEDSFENRATSFGRSGLLEPSNLDGVAGDGGVFSTLDDLANWAKFWSDDRLLSRDLKDRATGKAAQDSDGYHFGLIREGDLVEHSGSWLGARTYLGFRGEGEEQDVVILLENGSSIFIDDLREQIWTALPD
ncbi:Serine-type D-Ala-D-Ala carboxypeptidase [Altererythrobacter insulae]|nr:Serine-type D-Ala-D-Ala carboxypeptidase [Altererythrobacter insulae]